MYGQGNDFVQNMEMLKRAEISETRILVLNPDYVRRYASEGAFARVSGLSSFNYDSRFNTFDRDFNNLSRIRGVPKKTDREQSSTAGADAQTAGSPFREQGAILGPSVDEVLTYSASYVPEGVREQYKAGLQKLYKK